MWNAGSPRQVCICVSLIPCYTAYASCSLHGV